jgi:hypothetical protein
MRRKSEKSVLDRLLGDWWVDAGVVMFVIVMLAITNMKWSSLNQWEVVFGDDHWLRGGLGHLGPHDGVNHLGV